MEFEDMQVIWNNQNDEKLYVIDETALHKQIKQKEASADSTLNKMELIMIGVNLLVAVVLTAVMLIDGEPLTDLIIPALYLAYGLGMIWYRQKRQINEPEFAPTMLGDLDRAIWKVDTIIKRTHQLNNYYLLPLLGFISIFLLVTGSPWLALAVVGITLPIGYFGGRWEVNRCHIPKKRELESLREKLLATPEVIE